MQMKMDKTLPQKFDKQRIRQILEAEDEFISTLFDSFEVPDSIEGEKHILLQNYSIFSSFFPKKIILFHVYFADESYDDQFLLKSKEKRGKSKTAAHNKSQTDDKKSSVDLQQRLEIIRNKMKSKKTKPSARAIEKKKQKKLKKTKELKKKLISVAKSIKNEKVKEEKALTTPTTTSADCNGIDVKPDIKPDIKPKVFNEDGKMVFSKFEFSARPSLAKKSKKDSKQIKIRTNIFSY